MTDLALALALANACAETYVNGAKPTFEDENKTVHVFLSTVNGKPCFAFEGTQSFAEWVIDFIAVEIPVFAHPQLGTVHAGLWRSAEIMGPKIQQWLAAKGWPEFYVTGHSKGGGEAILTTAWLGVIGNAPLATWAFEPPRVGGDDLAKFLRTVDLSWTETFNSHGKDLVTQVPFGPTWKHEGPPLVLAVGDELEIPDKHRIPAVIAALTQMQAKG